MQVYRFLSKGFAANTYLVTADGKEGICIDPASPYAAKQAKATGIKIGCALLTHGHFDHIGGCAALQETGTEIGCFEEEKELALFHDLAREFGFGPVSPFRIDFEVKDLTRAGLSVQTIHTPGHTAGSVCYLVSDGSGQRVLFTGDTLFRGGMGRTDLPTGSEEALFASLKKLAALPFDCPIYPGHGEESTLMYEKMHNGYLKC